MNAVGTPLLTVADVATKLRIKPARVYDLVAKGELPGLRVGRFLRFVPAHLEQWEQEAIEKAERFARERLAEVTS